MNCLIWTVTLPDLLHSCFTTSPLSNLIVYFIPLRTGENLFFSVSATYFSGKFNFFFFLRQCLVWHLRTPVFILAQLRPLLARCSSTRPTKPTTRGHRWPTTHLAVWRGFSLARWQQHPNGRALQSKAVDAEGPAPTTPPKSESSASPGLVSHTRNPVCPLLDCSGMTAKARRGHLRDTLRQHATKPSCNTS